MITKLKSLKLFFVLVIGLNLCGCNVVSDMVQKEIASNTTTITGKATLHNQTDNTGIVVKIGKQTESTNSLSTQAVIFTQVATTTQTGFFSIDVTMTAPSASFATKEINLATGLYTVQFSKEGYDDVVVENVPVVLGQSTYSLTDVELEQTINYIDVPVGVNMELLVLTNNTDQYQLSLYNSTVSDNTRFDLIYWNLQGQYGMFFVENATWQQVENTIITGHQNCSIKLYIHNGGSPAKVNVTKL